MHGPSTRTVLVRKLVRKQLLRIVPWTEENTDQTNATDEATPSQAEFRGAGALDPQDADWADLRETELAEHLQEFEAPVGGEFSFEEAVTPATAAAVSSTAAAAADTSIPDALPAPVGPTEAEDLAAFNSLFAIKGRKRKRSSLQPAPPQPARAQPVELPENDPDILELQGLLEQRSLVAQQQRERTARNREAALAQRAARAKPKAKSSWNITVATSSHFGTDGNASAAQATLTASQRARVACSLAAAPTVNTTAGQPSAATEASRHSTENLSSALHEPVTLHAAAAGCLTVVPPPEADGTATDSGAADGLRRPPTSATAAEKKAALRANNRAKMVATIRRKRATKGFQALSGMQRAILYDANVKHNSASSSSQRPSMVHVEDWEREDFGTTVAPFDEASAEDDDEASEEEAGPGTVDPEFAESYQAFVAAAAEAAAAAATRADPSSSANDHPCLGATTIEHNRAPTEHVGAPTDLQATVEPLVDAAGHDLDALRDLVELTEDGERVCWPGGLNLLTARLLLSSASRPAFQQTSRSAAAVPPARNSGTADLPQSADPWNVASRISPSDAPT